MGQRHGQSAEWVARQLTEAFPWREAPRHLIRDRDAVYGGVFHKRLGAMGIRDHPTAPRSPWQTDVIDKLFVRSVSYNIDAHG